MRPVTGAVLVASLALGTVGAGAVPATATVPAAAAVRSADRVTLVSDSMSRKVVQGLGVAPVGGAYQVDEPAHVKVDGKRAVLVVTPGTDRKAALPARVSDSDARFTFRVNRVPKSGRVIIAHRARSESGNEYRLRLQVKKKGVAHLTVGRFAPSGGRTYQVGPKKRLPFRVKPGREYMVRAYVSGGSSVDIRMKAWQYGRKQPRWQLKVRDTSTSRITTPGQIGFLAYISRAVPKTRVIIDRVGAVGSAPVAAPAPAPAPPPPPAPAPPPTAPPAASGGVVGARLPLTAGLPLGSSPVYVSLSGSDAAAGTVDQPMRTLSAAIGRARSSSDPTVVVRGGIYRESDVVVSGGPPVTIRAYPGEVPEFRGSVALPDGWTTEGAVAHHPYTPQPVTNGGGISFTSNQNLTGKGVGKYPDQAWVGAERLRQVLSLAEVVPGTFWVDRSAGRIYVSSQDLARGGLEVSDQDVFLTVRSPGTVVAGLRVARYSNSGNDHGVIQLNGSADGSGLQDVEILDASFQALSLLGSGSTGGILDGVTLQNVTIARSNWMGIAATWVDNLEMRSVLFDSLNMDREFKDAPVSGAIKATRTRHAEVIDSQVKDVKGHGLWFDQSSAHVVIAGNDISDVSGSSVFFEISDDLLMVNNVVRSTGQRVAKLAGASGLKLVNNTLVGGADPVGIYADSRSKPGCADPSQPRCEGSYSSDRDGVRPRLDTLDWIPRLDLMINNVLAHPRSRGYCGTPTTVCVMQRNSGANIPIETVIHQADPSRGIPQTWIDGNVYAIDSRPAWSVNPFGSFSTHSDFGAAMASAPVSIPGFERSGLTGAAWVGADGSPSAALTSMDRYAVPIPVDPAINEHLPAGLRNYGAVR